MIILDSINDTIKSDITATNEVITSSLQTDIELIHDISQHIIDGGKRVRPLLVLLCAHCFDYSGKHHHTLAAIIEFIHTATLLHDDVVDGSVMRRGKKTANDIWGNESSVLVGDFLYSRSFQALISLNNINIMKVIADASNKMAEGEVLQLMNRHNPDVTEEEYYKVIENKTAKLFEAATETSAVLCELNQEHIDACKSYGSNLGLAFQLIDDALDYSGDTDLIGKNIGDDLAEGKVTLPLLYLLQYGNESEVKLIRTAIQTGGLELLDEIKTAVINSDAINYTEAAAIKHVELAKKALESFPASKYRDALAELADFVIQRNH